MGACAAGLPEQPFVSCNYHSDQDFIQQERGGCVTYEINKGQVSVLT